MVDSIYSDIKNFYIRKGKNDHPPVNVLAEKKKHLIKQMKR